MHITQPQFPLHNSSYSPYHLPSLRPYPLCSVDRKGQASCGYQQSMANQVVVKTKIFLLCSVLLLLLFVCSFLPFALLF